jgi:hypothetical protein
MPCEGAYKSNTCRGVVGGQARLWLRIAGRVDSARPRHVRCAGERSAVAFSSPYSKSKHRLPGRSRWAAARRLRARSARLRPATRGLDPPLPPRPAPPAAVRPPLSHGFTDKAHGGTPAWAMESDRYAAAAGRLDLGRGVEIFGVFPVNPRAPPIYFGLRMRPVRAHEVAASCAGKPSRQVGTFALEEAVVPAPAPKVTGWSTASTATSLAVSTTRSSLRHSSKLAAVVRAQPLRRQARFPRGTCFEARRFFS